MSVSTDNNTSVKKWNKIRYKNLEIEIEKMWLLKTTIIPLIVGTLSMIKKRTDKHINKILSSLNLYELQKLQFAEMFISLGEYYLRKKKSNTQKRQ